MERFLTHCLRPLPPQAYKDGKIGVLDMETGIPYEDPLGGTYVISQVRLSDTPDSSYNFDNICDLLAFLFSKRVRGYTLYAHNGGHYDFLYVYQYLSAHTNDYPGLTIKPKMRKDGHILELCITRHKQTIRLRDSYVLIPTSLEQLTEALAPEWHKKDRTWKIRPETQHLYDQFLPDGKKRHWQYDQHGAFTYNYFNPESPQDMEYLDFDTRGLLEGLLVYFKLIHKTFGVNCSLTASGTALKAWQRTMQPDEYHWRQRPEVETFCRHNYSGGLVFLTTLKECHHLVQVDENAKYAAMMRRGVPIGTAVEVEREYPGYPGFYQCYVDVPTSERYPWIPNKEHDLQWARGQFSCVLTTLEIDYARSLGYPIIVGHGYIFQKIGLIFNTFVDMCERLELPNKKNAIGFAVKIFRNSLYGRFALRSDGQRIAFFLDEPTFPWTPVIREDGNAVQGVYYHEDILNHPCMQVHWAAWITAHARISENQLARATHAVYGDTDCVVSFKEQIEQAIARGVIKIGPKYGEYKIEHQYKSFQAYGPKNYTGVDIDDITIDKAKGMPRDLIGDRSRTEIPYTSVNSLKSLMKTGTIAMTRMRSFSSIANSHSWQVEDDLEVWPILIS